MTRVIQEHHIKYLAKNGEDQTVLVFRGEHQILTLIQRYERNSVSQGFIKALRLFLLEKRGLARRLHK